jgi:hypothetical protein
MEGYDYDLYVSTYYKLERDGSEGDNKILTKNEIVGLFDGLPLKNIELISEEWKVTCLKCNKKEAFYGPKEYISYKTGLKEDRTPCAVYCENCKELEMVETDGVSYWQQWRHVWNCYNMAREEEKKSGIMYDYHVRSRPDVIYLEKVDFNNIPPLDNKLYSGFGATLGSPDDMFAVGKGKAWDHYCDIRKVLLHSLHAHELTEFTFKVYPVCKLIQIGVIRYKDTSASGLPVTITKMGGGKIRIVYDKLLYISDKSLV